jgi:hypothetical protein
VVRCMGGQTLEMDGLLANSRKNVIAYSFTRTGSLAGQRTIQLTVLAGQKSG